MMLRGKSSVGNFKSFLLFDEYQIACLAPSYNPITLIDHPHVRRAPQHESIMPPIDRTLVPPERPSDPVAFPCLDRKEDNWL